MAGTADRVYLEWITDHRPTEQEVYDEQSRRGMHPMGYDGPFQIKTEKIENSLDKHGNRYKTTWFCYGSTGD